MFELRCETVIGAPVERVWEVLADVRSYPDWNPLVRSFVGELREGAAIRAVFEPTPGRTLTSTVRVSVWDPPHRLAWTGKFGVSWLVRGEHVYTLEPVGDGTRLVNREVFEGLLVPLARPLLARSLPTYEANNEAIRKRAEQPPR